MAYFLKTYIPDNKKLKDALVMLYGIGNNQASFICKSLGFQKNMYFNLLNRNQLLALKRFIESNFTIGFDLRQEVDNNIRNLVFIKSYRGNRHRNKYPVRGQRTRTNAKTQRRFNRFKKL